MNPIEQTATEGGFDLAWIDQIGAVLVLLFLVLGAFRGLWWQILRLVGVVAGIVVARQLTPRVAPNMKGVLDMSESTAHAVTWLMLFVGVLVLAALVGVLGKKLLQTAQLGLFDRFGGALAGGFTGLVLHASLLLVMAGMGTDDWATSVLEGTYSAKVYDQASGRFHLLMDAQAAEKTHGTVMQQLFPARYMNGPLPQDGSTRTGDTPNGAPPTDIRPNGVAPDDADLDYDY
tara:strand:+ start:3984 stop:4679 length:696 start_codon:yes stop_codon:yes gene_type:complete